MNFWWIFFFILMLMKWILFVCTYTLLVCLSVTPFVYNKFPKVWTDWVQIFYPRNIDGQLNWIMKMSFCLSSSFLIPLSLYPETVDLRYFKLLILLDLNGLGLKYLKTTPSAFRKIKVEFVANTQFLCLCINLFIVYSKILFKVLQLRKKRRKQHWNAEIVTKKGHQGPITQV